MTYICPMHPEVTQAKPGRCPKCGMKLVKESEMHTEHHSHHDSQSSWKDYLPLIIIIGLILLTAVAVSIRDLQLGVFNLDKTIMYFMIGFFLIFSGFKLIDLKGFAEGYSTYDLLAQRWYGYGYIYPFIELFFALAMIVSFAETQILWLEVAVMLFSGIGVAIKIAKKETFQCACLGTFLKVPLTSVTLIEDFGMAALALYLLIS